MKQAAVSKDGSYGRRLTAAVMMGVLVVSTACRVGLEGRTMSQNSYETSLAEVRAVLDAEGYYSFPAWWGEWIVVQHTPTLGSAFNPRIWRLRPDGSGLAMIDLPNHPSCGLEGVNRFLAPAALPDGRLAYAVDCSPAGDPFGARTNLMVYNPARGDVEQLLNYPLPSEYVGTGGYAWNPEMTRMIMGDGHRYIEEQLSWFTRDAWQPLDVGLAQAYSPSWSPGGKQIAFIGSQGRGSPTAGSEYNLFLMNADGTNIHTLATGFLHAVGVAWSPDARWLAFSAAPKGRRGLWLVDPTTGKMRLFAEGAFDVPRWSADGQQIVTVQFEPGADPPKDRVVIVEVGPVLGD